MSSSALELDNISGDSVVSKSSSYNPRTHGIVVALIIGLIVLLILVLIGLIVYYTVYAPKDQQPQQLQQRADNVSAAMPFAAANILSSSSGQQQQQQQQQQTFQYQPPVQKSPFWRLPDDYRPINSDGSQNAPMPRFSDANDNLQQYGSASRRGVLPPS